MTTTATETKPARHTPSPWRVANYQGKGVGPYVIVEAPCVGTLLSVSGPRPSPTGMVQDRDTAVANARLIAAAPELLEALRLAYENAHRWTGSTGPHAAEFAEKARAAIAKAEGRA